METPHFVQRGAEANGAVFDGDGPVVDIVALLGHPADEFVDVVDD